jgi:putative acyl-CoA dehydrogenase
MRAGLVQAVHHARHRSAFGKPLIDQSAMRNVLADLALESEAATVLMMRVARAYDAAPAEDAFRRLATPDAKNWVCKRAPGHASEALEWRGGNGYVEESGLPRIYRDAPLNSIWEGSGNVAALDVLRALRKEPECLPAFLAECDLAAGADRRLDAHLAETRSRLAGLSEGDPEFAARRVVADLCLALQASLLVRQAPAAVADAFCAGRLNTNGHTYGMLPGSVDVGPILDRALAS